MLAEKRFRLDTEEEYQAYQQKRTEIRERIEQGGIYSDFTTYNPVEMRLAVSVCEEYKIPVADVFFSYTGDKYLLGEEVSLPSILHPQTLFSFSAYKKCLTLLAWRNNQLSHHPNLGDKIEISYPLGNLLIEKYAPEEGKKEENVFSALHLSTSSIIYEDMLRCAAPTVYVGLGLNSSFGVADTQKAMRKIYEHCFGLTSGVRTNFWNNSNHIELLEGLVEIYAVNESTINVIGQDNYPQRRLKSGLHYTAPRLWQGSSADVANFFSILEQAFEAIQAKPRGISGNGVNYYGLSLLFCDPKEKVTDFDNDLPKSARKYECEKEWKLPEQYMGLIQTSIDFRDNNLGYSLTRVYAGNELPLHLRLVTE